MFKLENDNLTMDQRTVRILNFDYNKRIKLLTDLLTQEENV